MIITFLHSVACSSEKNCKFALELVMRQPCFSTHLAVDCLAATAFVFAGFTAAQAVALSNITILGGSLVGAVQAACEAAAVHVQQ